MMDAMPSNDNIRIANTYGIVRAFLLLAGFMGGFLCIPCVMIAASGQWGMILLLLGIVSLMAILGVIFHYLIPDVAAILSRDQIVLPQTRWRNRVVLWSEIQTIEWPRGGGDSGPNVYLLLPNTNRMLCPHFSLSGDTISNADRIVVIQYLRRRGKNTPQTYWPEFCERFAAPWVEAKQKEEDQAKGRGVEEPQFWVAARLRRFFKLGEQHPLLIGFLSPLVIPFFMAAMVSRKSWWIFAGVLGVSTTVNLPLIFGWNWKVVAVMLALTVGPLLLSLFSPPDEDSPNTPVNPANHVPGGIAVLFGLCFGLPFLLAAALHGWISATVGRYVMYCTMGLLFPMLLLLLVRRQKRILDEDKEERGSRAMKRWETYENTGSLPKA